MNTRRFKLLFLTLALAVGSLTVAQPAQADVHVDVGIFYNSLAPYGPWVQYPGYGWVWHPQAVAVGWSPYVDGQWAYANEYGWTWASQDPWGWATDHYGRWLYDPAYGWLWVPGYEWGPAWVDWVAYDGYVGWAPLPPAATWSVNVGFAPGYDVGYDRYTFVEPRYLGATTWQSYAVPRDRSVRFARAARRITRYDDWGGRVVNRSVAYVPRTTVSVVDVGSSRSLRRAVQRGELTVFRPRVARNPDLLPRRREDVVVRSANVSPREAVTAEPTRFAAAARTPAPARHFQQTEHARPHARQVKRVQPTVRHTAQAERARPQAGGVRQAELARAQRRLAAAPVQHRQGMKPAQPGNPRTVAPSAARRPAQHVRPQQVRSRPHDVQVSASRHPQRTVVSQQVHKRGQAQKPATTQGGKPRRNQGNGHGRS
jgi:hypothetical protein